MKMKLNALSLAVAAACAVGTAAHAESVALFPYVVASPTVTTIVSVIDTAPANSGYNSDGTGAGNNLHWRLHFKKVATDNSSTCKEVNRYLPSSTNDLQTVDLSGKFGSTTKGVLFNDPGVKNNWKTSAYDFMLAKEAMSTTGENVMRGLLFVHNDNDSTTTPTVRGEAMILEFGSGAAWGYRAIHNYGQEAAGFDFSGNNASQSFNLVGSNLAQPLTIMPASQVVTRLFVTPLNTAILNSDGVSNGSLYTNPTITVSMVGANGQSGFHDRDEGFQSGTTATDVTCVGAIDVESLMGASQRAAGGWSNIKLSATTDASNPADGAYVTKLEFSTGAPFNGEGSFGTFNNGFIMR